MSSLLRYFAVGLAVIAFPVIASAHRLDEYLQAARINVEHDGIKTEISLTPGAAVADDVIAMIDGDGNGEISESERVSYARSVSASLSLEIDGQRQSLYLDTFSIPSLAEMRRGEGVIRLRTSAKISNSLSGPHHLRFAASHRSDIGVYMVNALVPSDPRVQIHGMSRDLLQREFDLDYSLAPSKQVLEIATFWPPLLGLALSAVLLAFLRR